MMKQLIPVYSGNVRSFS